MFYPWQVRCLVDNMKALVPFQQKARACKRMLFGYQADAPHQPGAIEDALCMVERLTSHLGGITGRTVLEIGTGWEPIIPLVFHLAGASVVYLTDTARLLCVESLDAALKFLESSADRISNRLALPRAGFDQILSRGVCRSGLETSLDRLGLKYLAPCDCRNLRLNNHSLDIVYSRAVLEHIPPPVLRAVFRECKRVLKPTGVMCHIVDNSDHFEHRDKSISRVHFLQHGERMMKFIGLNQQNYQNRLRHQDYLDLIQAEGFKIIAEDREIDRNALIILPKMRLAPGFANRPLEDLAAITSYILAACVS
jgi:SAM-dependent methyltransferase